MSSRPEPGAAPPADARRAPTAAILPEEILAVACMVVLVLLTGANVLVRYFTDESFAATEEISIALMVVMTVAGACAAAARDRHVRIEYFYETGGAARRRRLALLSATCTCAFFLLLGVLSARVVWDEYSYQETTMALGLPRWWLTVWVPLLCGVLALRAAGVAGKVRRGLMLPGADADAIAAGSPLTGGAHAADVERAARADETRPR
ncbi:MAG TPA: TRAP transporter small permease [Burkholderiaceae bacterium]|nr:TRAP transporter small permease [Burkholderiaceae bacterium]